MSLRLPIAITPGAFFLLETRKREQSDLLLLAAELARKTGVIIIDGGNHFNVYSVVKAIRMNSDHLLTLSTIHIARAFNCHQIVTLVQEIPQDGTPCLIIDVLDTFQDDNIPLSHRIYLIKKLLNKLKLINRQAAIFISLAPPKDNEAQWNLMASFIRRATTRTLQENFMGKTLPTINQIIQQAEVILAKFSRALQPEERKAMDLLFIGAKKHIAAISEANHLIPFEAAQQAMLLEQQKEIAALNKMLSELENRLEKE